MTFDFGTLVTNMWGTAGILTIFGLGMLILTIRGKEIKLNKWKIPAGIGFAVLLVIGLHMAGLTEQLGVFAVAPRAVIPVSQVQEPEAGLQIEEPSLDMDTSSGKCVYVQNTHALKTAVYNRENASSLGYLAGSVTAESDGTTLDTDTTTSGVSLSYTNLDVTPCKTGGIYIFATSGIGTASARVPFSSWETQSEYVIQGAASDVIAILAYDRQGNKRSSGCANGSVGTECSSGYFVSGASTTDGSAYYKNTSLDTGGSIQGQIGLDVNGTSTVFGNYGLTTYNKATGEWEHTIADDGVLLSYDSVDASKFSSNSFTFTGGDIPFKKIVCPATIIANRNAEACWQTRTLKASDGEVLSNFQLSADAGNPAVDSSDSPKLCVDDKVYFRGVDGKVKYDYYSSGGTNQGTAGVCLTFVTA